MSSFGRFMLGCGIIGAVAGGVYYYLDSMSKEKAQEAPETGSDEEVRTAAEEVEDAASRAYTTIRHSTDETLSRVKEAIGPKGEDVLEVVGETAARVKDVVLDSAEKVREIYRDKEARQEEEAFEEAPDTADGEVAGDLDENTASVLKEKAEEALQDGPAEEQDAAEAPDAEEISSLEKAAEEAAAKKVEEFFNDSSDGV